jgi:hypothetical protein
MTAEIFKFPYDACRRVHSKKPRRSKNGTPEEWAAKAAAEQWPAADVVTLSVVPDAEPLVDRRKLRGNPLRGLIATVSFGATVVGKIHTSGLKGEPLEAISPEIRKEWLATLNSAIDAVATVSTGLDQALETLTALQSKAEPDLQDIIDGYAQSPPHVQQIISDMLREGLAKQPPEPEPEAIMKRRSAVEELKADIERSQAAKRRALAVADERAKEACELRLENERLRAQLAEQRDQ